MLLPLRPAVCLLALFVPVTCLRAEGMTFTRERFDEMDRAIDATRNPAKATADDFAWGESYMLRGYLEMYRATGDRDYLRRLVRVGDQALAVRDDRRPGHSPDAKPLWSVGAQYTLAYLTLKDGTGRDCISLRGIRYAYNNQTTVEVIPGPTPESFCLRTENPYWAQYGTANVTFANLSLDPELPRYFEGVINDPAYIPDEGFQHAAAATEKASFLLVATDLRRGREGSRGSRALDSAHTRDSRMGLAALPPTALVPAMVPYYGYIGPIYSGMTGFASLVHRTPELQAEFGAAARRFIKAARESVGAWEGCWRQGPEAGEGYYLLEPKGAPFWCDGIAAPLNYLGSAGQVLLGIWDCTGDATALDHATRIARLFRRCCRKTPKGGYTFNYWSHVGDTGWTKAQGLSLNTPEYPKNPVPDDLSHGAWELEFAIMCHEQGLVFTRSDMARFARTFTRQLWTGDPKTLARRVDGSGGPAEGDSLAGARWTDLCPYEPRIFEMNRALWEQNGWDKGAYGHLTGSYARMLRWQGELGRGCASVP